MVAVKKIVLSRAFAKHGKARFYYTGRPCKYGHLAERYTRTGHCVECVRVRNRNRYDIVS